MRGLNKLCVVALFGVVVMAAAQASALNVDNIIIYKGIERTNGVINTNGYVFHVEVSATGMDNGGVFQNMTNGTWFLLASDGPNRWEYNNNFASQALLDAAHQSSVNYFFLLNSLNSSNHSLPPFTDQVQVGFAVNPPAVFANISNPLHNAVGVPLNPIYAWDNMSGGTKSHILGLFVDDNAGNTVYRDFPEANTGKTTWQPGPLAPLSDYSFSVMNIRLTGTSVQRLSTPKNDLFNYYGGNGQENTVDFTTLPEPATMALVGTAALGLIGWRRRRSMK